MRPMNPVNPRDLLECKAKRHALLALDPKAKQTGFKGRIL